MRNILIFAAAALATFMASAVSAQPAVRFCPAERLWTHSENDAQQVRSLLVPNIVVANPDGTALTLERVEIALMDGDRVMDLRRLEAPELVRAGAMAPMVEQLGALLPGQFCSGRALGGLAPAHAATIEPGQALVIMAQTFGWSGRRDAVRVTGYAAVDGRPVEISAAIPVDTGVSRTSIRFPLSGVWYVGAGGTAHSHHRWVIFEEFALDIARVDGDGLTRTGDGTRFEDYYAYGAPVLAVADGVVVAALDGIGEDPEGMQKPGETSEAYLTRLIALQGQRLSEGMAGVIGNHVVIDHGGEYSMYAHLKPGSVGVQVGQQVRAGEVIGGLGSSGNSTEPHLHFQMCDGPDPTACHALPPNFVGVRIPMELAPRSLQTGDVVVAD